MTSLSPHHSAMEAWWLRRRICWVTSRSTSARKAVGGVAHAGEHEVLPDHEAELVAQLVEIVGLVLAAAPDAQHVHVGGAGALQQVAHRGGGDARGDGIGWNPVRPHRRDVAAVHPHLEIVIDGVLLDDPVELAQADAARRALAVECRPQLVKVLLALPGRPPQFRVADGHVVGEDVLARPHHELVAELLAGDLVHQLHRAFGEGEDAGGDRQLHRSAAVDLRHRDALLPCEARAAQRHAAIDADGHEADAPVPAGVAGGLAHEVHVHAGQAVAQIILRVGDGERVRLGARLRHVRRHREVEAQRVGAGPDLAGDVDVVAQELVLGARDLLAVQPDGGDAIDVLERQGEVAGDVVGGRGEAAFHRPRHLMHPEHRLLVGAGIGVGNVAGGEQRGVHVAGQRDGLRLEPPVGRCKGESAAEVQFPIGRSAHRFLPHAPSRRLAGAIDCSGVYRSGGGGASAAWRRGSRRGRRSGNSPAPGAAARPSPARNA